MRRLILFQIAAFLLFSTFVIKLMMDSYVVTPPKQTYGVSFSKKYAEELGLDWQATYQDILTELSFKKLRLMSYWNEAEPAPGEYMFKDLDWQFEQAQKHGAKVSLVVGLRQPRWPECHEPDWAKQLAETEFNTALYNYVTAVVERYKTNAVLESWQLENEALNSSFGECPPYNRTRLKTELDLVKKLDPNHPVYMSLSDQHGLPLNDPVPDGYGFSIYRIFYNKNIYHGYLWYPTPVWYHRLRASIIRVLHQKPIFVHELQAEPWGPEPTKSLSQTEQSKSMNPSQLMRNIEFTQQIGVADAYLWGAEWWYWQKENGHPEMWQTVKDVMN